MKLWPCAVLAVLQFNRIARRNEVHFHGHYRSRGNYVPSLEVRGADEDRVDTANLALADLGGIIANWAFFVVSCLESRRPIAS